MDGIMKPAAYRHALRIEPHDQWQYELTESSESPFGQRGKDYDPQAAYTCEPLYLSAAMHERALRLAEQVMKTWSPPLMTGDEQPADIAQTATMIAIAYIMGREFMPGDLTDEQRAAIESGLHFLNGYFQATAPNPAVDETPSLEDWLDGWAAEVESGQSRISRHEAERRYYATYGRGRGDE